MKPWEILRTLEAACSQVFDLTSRPSIDLGVLGPEEWDRMAGALLGEPDTIRVWRTTHVYEDIRPHLKDPGLLGCVKWSAIDSLVASIPIRAVPPAGGEVPTVDVHLQGPGREPSPYELGKLALTHEGDASPLRNRSASIRRDMASDPLWSIIGPGAGPGEWLRREDIPLEARRQWAREILAEVGYRQAGNRHGYCPPGLPQAPGLRCFHPSGPVELAPVALGLLEEGDAETWRGVGRKAAEWLRTIGDRAAATGLRLAPPEGPAHG